MKNEHANENYESNIIYRDETFKIDDMVRNDHMDEFKQPWWNSTHKIDHMDEIVDTCDFNDMEEINNSHHIRCGRSMTIWLTWGTWLELDAMDENDHTNAIDQCISILSIWMMIISSLH